ERVRHSSTGAVRRPGQPSGDARVASFPAGLSHRATFPSIVGRPRSLAAQPSTHLPNQRDVRIVSCRSSDPSFTYVLTFILQLVRASPAPGSTSRVHTLPHRSISQVKHRK